MTEKFPADFRFTYSEEELFGAEFVNARKELMRQAVQAAREGRVVKLVCDGETMGFLVSDRFIGPSHPEFELRKQHGFPFQILT